MTNYEKAVQFKNAIEEITNESVCGIDQQTLAKVVSKLDGIVTAEEMYVLLQNTSAMEVGEDTDSDLTHLIHNKANMQFWQSSTASLVTALEY